MIEFIKKEDDFKKLFTDENEKRSPKMRSGSFDPSQITQCRRRIAYRLLGENKKNDNLYFKQSHHTAIVDKWIKFFKDCKKTHIVEEHAIVADAEYNLKGIADVLIEYDEIMHAVIIKPVSDECFSKAVERGGLRKDVIDLMLCMWMSEVPYGILIYENNDNQEMEIFEVRKCDLIINEVKNKCKELIPYQLRGILPKRDYKDSTGIECTVCEYRKTCFKTKGK